MRRDEAINWVGKPVFVWTAMNGEYHGILVDVIAIPNSPFRAKVEVKEVVRLPVLFELGRRKQREPFPEGKIIEVGAVSLRKLPEDYKFRPYKESLKEAIEYEEKQLKKWLEDSERLYNNTKLARYATDIAIAKKSLERLEELKRNV